MVKNPFRESTDGFQQCSFGYYYPDPNNYGVRDQHISKRWVLHGLASSDMGYSLCFGVSTSLQHEIYCLYC